MERIQMMDESGEVKGVTFRQAAATISRATGNNVVVNPFDARSIERTSLEFGGNMSGGYPSISVLEDGGFEYETISGRTLSVYPDEEGWALDCTDWWRFSENFRATVLECLEEVLGDARFLDSSLPDPEAEHVHCGEEVLGEKFFLCYTPVNNHSCTGSYVEVEATSSTEGTVVAGNSCSSCWQVGHDRSGSPVPIGAQVELPEEYCWRCASEADPDFMSSRDVSRNERTMVESSELVILEMAEAD